jgi:hypothetical protein
MGRKRLHCSYAVLLKFVFVLGCSVTLGGCDFISSIMGLFSGDGGAAVKPVAAKQVVAGTDGRSSGNSIENGVEPVKKIESDKGSVEDTSVSIGGD